MGSPTLMRALGSLLGTTRFLTKRFTLTEPRVTVALAEQERSRFITTTMSEPTTIGLSARCEAASSCSMKTRSADTGQARRSSPCNATAPRICSTRGAAQTEQASGIETAGHSILGPPAPEGITLCQSAALHGHRINGSDTLSGGMLAGRQDSGRYCQTQ